MTNIADLVLERDRLGPLGRILLGLFLGARMLIQLILLIILWPEAIKTEGPWDYKPLGFPITQEVALILSIALLGAMGGTTHALSSFTRFAGNRNLVRSWVWWYILRAPIGMSLAVVIYFVIRGGLLATTSSSAGAVNPYGLGAVAALAGLCSESATRKLSEVFDTLFKSDTKADKDTLAGSHRPTLASIAPSPLAAGTADTVITLTGTEFRPDDLLLINDQPITLIPISATQARATIPASLLAAKGELLITIQRLADPAVTSDSFKLPIA